MAMCIEAIRHLTLEVRTHAGHILPVAEGMDVVGLDTTPIGHLKEVRDGDILVDRPWQRDIYVPFDAIHTVTYDAIVLTIPADRVATMHWPHPELL